MNCVDEYQHACDEAYGALVEEVAHEIQEEEERWAADVVAAAVPCPI